MAKPKQGAGDPPAGNIASQIIVTFDAEKLGASNKDDATRSIEPVLAALKERPVSVVHSFVSNPSGGKLAQVVLILQLDDPAFGVGQLREYLRNDPRCKDIVDRIERNAPITMAAFDDPRAGEQWALAKLGVTAPWTVTPPAGKTLVAILDSGLRRHDGSVHADLGSVELPADCQPTGFYPDNIDREGHGTLLAGTIAALQDNLDVAGDPVGIASPIAANWNISLLPVKFFEPDEQPSVGNAIIAIYHALDMGADVINASWHVALGDDRKALKDAFQHAKNEDCLMVVAAGNDGSNNEVYPTYPANYGSTAAYPALAVLTVAATDRNDDKASFSNYGPNIIDLAAPGQDILSTGVYLGAATPRYRAYHGTSAAAAHASSAAALVIALNRAHNWKPKVTMQHLVASANEVPGLTLSVIGGKRLNIRRAIEGPLQVTAPTAADALTIGTGFTIRWINQYKNPHFAKVRVRYSRDDGATWRTISSPAGVANFPGTFAWTPEAGGSVDDRTPGGAKTGIIRITPTTGNFPAVSRKFKVT